MQFQPIGAMWKKNMSLYSYYDYEQNKWLFGAMALTLILTTAVIYVPFLANAFEFTAISLKEYGACVGLGLVTVPVVELVKAVQRAFKKK